MRAFVMWSIILFYAYGSFVTVTAVGEPRKPITPWVALITAVTCGVLAIAVRYLGTSA